MNKLCDVIIAISVIVILTMTFGVGVQYAERKEATFRLERDAHVLNTWTKDGCIEPNHKCEYGDWCTQSYADHLRKTRGK